MNKNDFVFKKMDLPYKDYWYEATNETKEELTLRYMEQAMLEVSEVIYSEKEDIVGVKRIFPFNYDVILSEDEELKKLLKELVREGNKQ